MATDPDDITSGFIKITTDGDLEVIDANTIDDTYLFIIDEVEGDLDYATITSPLEEGIIFWFSDAGMCRFPINTQGTAFITRMRGFYDQRFHGPIIISRTDGRGNIAPLTADDISELRIEYTATRFQSGFNTLISKVHNTPRHQH